MLETLIALLVVFQLKHFIADYPLQNEYMLGKFKAKGWELPLAAHAGVHALFTFGIILCINPVMALPLAVLDFVIHFGVDRLKAAPNYGGKFKPDQKEFWWALGADQMAHHLTHYAIIFVALLV